MIEAVDPRRSLLYRSDRYREKLIAANVTQMVAVLAAVPAFYEELLVRCLVAAEHQRTHALIVLNKSDLGEVSAGAATALEPYRALGYSVLPLCARRDVEPLRPALRDHTSVLVGQSGIAILVQHAYRRGGQAGLLHENTADLVEEQAAVARLQHGRVRHPLAASSASGCAARGVAQRRRDAVAVRSSAGSSRDGAGPGTWQRSRSPARAC